jgi:hypothetical protein
VEIKHGASPGDQQLETYHADLASTGSAGAVVLLAPRNSYPFVPEPPPEVVSCHWQHAVRVAWRFRRQADEIGQFLIAELIDYMRQERLVDPDVITPVHLVALAEHRRAEDAVAGACEIASDYIKRHWNDPTACHENARHDALFGTGFWEAHPQEPRGEQAADWPEMWWDWNLRVDDRDLDDNRGGVPVFVSGVCTHRGEAIVNGQAGDAWAGPLESRDRFMRLSDRDSRARFSRVAYPEEVLVGRDLEAQGEHLGAWVVATYRALFGAGPPPRPALSGGGGAAG